MGSNDNRCFFFALKGRLAANKTPDFERRRGGACCSGPGIASRFKDNAPVLQVAVNEMATTDRS